MFWSVCRKVVCFAVVLHRKKVFFQFAASPPNFSLILLKTTFSSLSGYATLFLTICFWEQAFPFFGTKTALLTFYLTFLSFILQKTASSKLRLSLLWLSYTVSSISFLRTTFATFLYMKYVFDTLTYQKHVLMRL